MVNVFSPFNIPESGFPTPPSPPPLLLLACVHGPGPLWPDFGVGREVPGLQHLRCVCDAFALAEISTPGGLLILSLPTSLASCRWSQAGCLALVQVTTFSLIELNNAFSFFPLFYFLSFFLGGLWRFSTSATSTSRQPCLRAPVPI